MSLHQSYQYIEKTIERLFGIIGGIQIDGSLNDVEIARTKEWVETHKKLLDIEPFRELHELLTRCLDDGVIDDQERDEITEWCGMFINSDPFPSGITCATRRLHGVLSGIRIDGVIKDDEVCELRDWVESYGSYRNAFPFNELIPLLDRILADGVITTEEKKEILEFCDHFTERVVKDPVFHDDIYIESWMKTGSPVFEPILKFCDFNHKIHFHGSMFCFTGPARYGKRSSLFEMVEKCGGHPKNNVVLDLDYLVIGAQASPYWIYSTYGRKIESVIHNNKMGRSSITIIHEDDFVAQANEYLEK